MTAILVADNDRGSLRYITEVIEERGYSVVGATGPDEARAVLDGNRADVAVIDLRLENDTDQYDISGLRLAEQSSESIPKIIVSAFSSQAEMAEALKVKITGAPTIVGFVDKGNIATMLLPAIEDALRIKRLWSTTAINRVSQQLNEDYRTARKEARIHYWVSQGMSVGFALIIFAGAMQLHNEGSLPVLFAVAGVVVAEITNYILGRKLEFLNHRVERFHAELLETNRFEQLLDASFHIKDESARDAFKRELLSAAANHWMRGSPEEPTR